MDDSKFLHKMIICFALFILVGCIFYLNSWNDEFVRDDLHLIRSYTPHEIIGTFIGNWDPDNHETPGYRPITTLFNHMRYAIFGENVILHRFFLIALMACLLTILCDTFVLLGINLSVGILASIIVICSCNNFYHITWLTDGIHIFASLLSIASLNLSIRSYLKESNAKVVLAHLLGFLGIIARDENLALYIIAFTFPVFYSILFYERKVFKSRLIIKYILPGLIFSILFLMLRAFFVPTASAMLPNGFTFKMIAQLFLNLAKTFCQTFNFLGLMGWSGLFVWMSIIGILISLGSFFGHTTHNGKVLILFCIFLLISMAPMCLFYRQNLLLNPTFFAGGIVALSLEPVFRKGSRVIKAGLIAFLCVLIIVMFSINRISQEALHPNSMATIFGYLEFFIVNKSSIPKERKVRITKRLHFLGFENFEHYTRTEFLTALNKMTRNKLPSKPKADAIFLPKRPFLGYPPYWWVMRISRQTYDIP